MQPPPWSFFLFFFFSPLSSLISINLKPHLEEHQARTCSLLFTHRLGRLFDILLECGCGLAFLTWLPLCSILPNSPCLLGSVYRSGQRFILPFLLLIWPKRIKRKTFILLSYTQSAQTKEKVEIQNKTQLLRMTNG